MNCVYLADIDCMLTLFLFVRFEWMCHIKPTWHKLPTYYKRWLKYFIFSADYLWRVQRWYFFNFKIYQIKKKQQRQRQRQRTKSYWDKLNRPSRTMNRRHRNEPKKKWSQKKNRSANAMHVCVFHLRLMMCHIYEVSDSGSLNDRQLSRAAHRLFTQNLPIAPSNGHIRHA